MLPNKSPFAPPADTEAWLALAERYFDAETTEEEELRLRRFLASAAADDARFDEAKAVMGFLATGRALRERRRSVAARRFSLWSTVGQVAACLLFAFWIGRPLFSTAPTDYVMYVHGERVTDKRAVMSEVETAMADIFAEGTAPTVEGQLNDIFNP